MVAETRRPASHAAYVQALLVGRTLPVIGLDMSANSTGVVVLDFALDVVYEGTIEPPCTGPERLHHIHQQLEMIARRYGPFDTMVREDYAVGATNKPYLLGEVGGIAQVALFRHVGRIVSVAPKQLKKFASGNAAASKAEVMRALELRRGFVTSNDDIADAYALALIGGAIAGYYAPKERAALEVLVALETEGSEDAKPKRKAMRRQASVLESELDV